MLCLGSCEARHDRYSGQFFANILDTLLPSQNGVVGRIYYESGSRPDSGSWFWMIDIYSWPVEHHPKEPHYGNVATKEDAMAAARRIWDMKP